MSGKREYVGNAVAAPKLDQTGTAAIACDAELLAQVTQRCSDSSGKHSPKLNSVRRTLCLIKTGDAVDANTRWQTATDAKCDVSTKAHHQQKRGESYGTFAEY